MNRPKKFTLPIILLPVTLTVFCVSVLTFLNIISFNKQVHNTIETVRESYISENKQNAYSKVRYIIDWISYKNDQITYKLEEIIKNKVDEAVSIANGIYEKNAGKVSDEHIKESIKAVLSNSEFSSENGYFFAVDLNTDRIVVHENPELIGYSMAEHRDAKGLHVLKLQKELLAKNDGAYHNMYFTKPGSKGEYNKRVYVKKFEPYNWLIGTGEYYEAIEKMSKKETVAAFKDFAVNSNNYLFVTEIKEDKNAKRYGEILINSNSEEMVGKKTPLDIKDSRGNEYFKKSIEEALKNDGAYIEYWYKKPHTDEEAKKMSYVYYYKQWNWLIGSGFYFDDIDEFTIEKKEESAAVAKNNIYTSIILAFVLSVCAALISLLTARKINFTINSYNNEITEMNKYLTEKVEQEVLKNRKQEQIIYEQKKLADMGKMLNAIAHQWRQPLNVLGLYGQEVSNRFSSDRLDKQFMTEFSKTHMDMVMYLSTTIDDFIKFFRPDQEKRVYDLSEQMRSLHNLLNIQFINNNIEIITSCSCSNELCNIKDFLNHEVCSNSEYKLTGYPGELKQALINILYNAKDAIEDSLNSGEIEKGIIRLHFGLDSENIEIRISNNGSKIPEETQQNIFQPYFTTKEEGKGTGLGLYIAKITIENNMNGSLSLDKDAEETTFVIKLPFEHPKG